MKLTSVSEKICRQNLYQDKNGDNQGCNSDFGQLNLILSYYTQFFLY